MNVLIAVDNSDASLKAVEFAASVLCRDPSGPQITLLHVVESLPEYIVSRSSDADDFRAVADDWESHNRDEGNRVLAGYKELMTSAGIAADCVQVKLDVEPALPEARKVAAAIEIIREMKEGGYNVVVLGRRAKSTTALPFLGSVAEKVLREAEGRTVWVVD